MLLGADDYNYEDEDQENEALRQQDLEDEKRQSKQGLASQAMEVAKQQAKQAVKKVAQKAAKEVGKKVAMAVGKFLLATIEYWGPAVLIILVVIGLIVVIAAILGGIGDYPSDACAQLKSDDSGYYNEAQGYWAGANETFPCGKTQEQETARGSFGGPSTEAEIRRRLEEGRR